jgi:hypothetical protein
MRVRVTPGMAAVRYAARIHFPSGKVVACWHTDLYVPWEGTWRAAWSQATARAPEDPPRPPDPPDPPDPQRPLQDRAA